MAVPSVRTFGRLLRTGCCGADVGQKIGRPNMECSDGFGVEAVWVGGIGSRKGVMGKVTGCCLILFRQGNRFRRHFCSEMMRKAEWYRMEALRRGCGLSDGMGLPAALEGAVRLACLIAARRRCDERKKVGTFRGAALQ